MNTVNGAGGTEGGVGTFVIGLLMAIVGGYLLTSQVTVTTGYWQLWGRSAFGLSLLPFVVGVGFLFFDGKSIVGWVLTVAGAVIIFAGILAHLDIYFQPTSLFNTLLMLILLLGGIGLVARSLRPQRS
jgi:predicted membrane channel-forming protein YqfA (hemolysin III family)